jgi:hypothetical protein
VLGIKPPIGKRDPVPGIRVSVTINPVTMLLFKLDWVRDAFGEIC